MSLNETPTAERVHIAFFGRRNAGKSSLINAVTGQEVSVVSETKGTTTDPVSKSMELFPLGPVVILDTPGYDDEGTLGSLRVRRTKQTLNRSDIAVLVVDSSVGMQECEEELLRLFQEKNLPSLVVWNKADLLPKGQGIPAGHLAVSAVQGTGLEEFKTALGKFVNVRKPRPFLADLIAPGETVLFVMPQDGSAPRARLILPQQMAIRDVLDAGGRALCVQPPECAGAIASLKTPPAIVVTDSQVFREAAAATPAEIPLTSFSILLARYKGFLAEALRGVEAISRLKSGDKILIAEGCTHHRQCNDIGSVKIPNLLRKKCGCDFDFQFSSGNGFPEDLEGLSLVIHCGGCMISDRELLSRMKAAQDQNVPFTNYGITLAWLNGILPRALTGLRGKTEC